MATPRKLRHHTRSKEILEGMMAEGDFDGFLARRVIPIINQLIAKGGPIDEIADQLTESTVDHFFPISRDEARYYEEQGVEGAVELVSIDGQLFEYRDDLQPDERGLCPNISRLLVIRGLIDALQTQMALDAAFAVHEGHDVDCIGKACGKPRLTNRKRGAGDDREDDDVFYTDYRAAKDGYERLDRHDMAAGGTAGANGTDGTDESGEKDGPDRTAPVREETIEGYGRSLTTMIPLHNGAEYELTFPENQRIGREQEDLGQQSATPDADA